MYIFLFLFLFFFRQRLATSHNDIDRKTSGGAWGSALGHTTMECKSIRLIWIIRTRWGKYRFSFMEHLHFFPQTNNVYLNLICLFSFCFFFFTEFTVSRCDAILFSRSWSKSGDKMHSSCVRCNCNGCHRYVFNFLFFFLIEFQNSEYIEKYNTKLNPMFFFSHFHRDIDWKVSSRHANVVGAQLCPVRGSFKWWRTKIECRRKTIIGATELAHWWSWRSIFVAKHRSKGCINCGQCRSKFQTKTIETRKKRTKEKGKISKNEFKSRRQYRK